MAITSRSIRSKDPRLKKVNSRSINSQARIDELDDRFDAWALIEWLHVDLGISLRAIEQLTGVGRKVLSQKLNSPTSVED